MTNEIAKNAAGETRQCSWPDCHHIRALHFRLMDGRYLCGPCSSIYDPEQYLHAYADPEPVAESPSVPPCPACPAEPTWYIVAQQPDQSWLLFEEYNHDCRGDGHTVPKYGTPVEVRPMPLATPSASLANSSQGGAGTVFVPIDPAIAGERLRGQFAEGRERSQRLIPLNDEEQSKRLLHPVRRCATTSEERDTLGGEITDDPIFVTCAACLAPVASEPIIRQHEATIAEQRATIERLTQEGRENREEAYETGQANHHLRAERDEAVRQIAALTSESEQLKIDVGVQELIVEQNRALYLRQIAALEAATVNDLYADAKHARVFEYDGAFQCLVCKAKWGVLPGNPKMPERCAPNYDEKALLDIVAMSDRKNGELLRQITALQSRVNESAARWQAEVEARNLTEQIRSTVEREVAGLRRRCVAAESRNAELIDDRREQGEKLVALDRENAELTAAVRSTVERLEAESRTGAAFMCPPMHLAARATLANELLSSLRAVLDGTKETTND